MTTPAHSTPTQSPPDAVSPTKNEVPQRTIDRTPAAAPPKLPPEIASALQLAMQPKPAEPPRRYGWLAKRLRRWLGIDHDATQGTVLRLREQQRVDGQLRTLTTNVSTSLNGIVGQTKQVARLAQDTDFRLRYYERHMDMMKTYTRRLAAVRNASAVAVKEQQATAAAETEPFDEHGVLKSTQVEG